MPKQIQGSQWSFPFGEVDVELKRADDHPARKGGLRQMANARIINAGGVRDRPGRRALYPITNGGVRTERFLISAGNVFDIQFAPGRLKIINPAGVTIANFTTQGNGAALPWASNTDINSIVYAILNLSITITFGHAMRPQVLTFDGVSAWSIADYNELVVSGGQKRTPFYRLSPQNVTLLPSGLSGAITVTFSSPIAVAGMTGTRVRFAGRQILLGALTGSSTMNATVIEPLPPSQSLALTGAVGKFNVGDEIIGNSSGAIGIAVSTPSVQLLELLAGNFAFQLPSVGSAITGGTSGATGVVTSVDTGSGLTGVSLNTGTAFVASETVSGSWGSNNTNLGVGSTSLIVQLLQNGNAVRTFSASEVIGGPSGSATTTGQTPGAPAAIAVWDDEVINAFRGYPASCFSDQFRMGFCDIPALPGGILWSAINISNDLYANDASSPDNSIFEIAPNKVQVYYVIPGPEGSEFVFTDHGVFYIPISETNPLKPGSVAFKRLSGDGSAKVQPKLAQEAILYVNAGANSIMAIIATGAYLRPYNTKNLSDYHSHLFNNISAIAAPGADGTFNERYAYVLNGDGSIAVGKYDADTLPGNQPVIGWGPWSGIGAVSWIAAYASDVIFTSSYFGAGVVEILDDSQYVDCALPVNALPAAFAAPAGRGPLWFIPSQSVTLIDQVTRVMGTYQIDMLGNIVPQNNGGENLAIASLVAGQPWIMTIEPFSPDASSGADVKQRMELRQYSKFAVYVIHSSGMVIAQLFSAMQTVTTPPLGTIMSQRRFPPWNQGDDPTKPPTLRETVLSWTPPGSSYDPRAAIIKDTPGPLTICEIAMEISL